jgi:hypothetical protein
MQNEIRNTTHLSRSGFGWGIFIVSENSAELRKSLGYRMGLLCSARRIRMALRGSYMEC